ncbi:aminoglycoside phosphotransferase family protein [Nocardioides sp. KIGAM211]|uniref:Aminoglycoside phosphotransferase family protein n=2 Tax=Nocardioides luti TaxID=2761101 RepID=A0A7X0RD78_9ACTN|nr:aminoglycoside phosphotransferase family protein [Nocardioides luti]
MERAAATNELHRPVEVTGETVVRPATPASATVHAFLRHLGAQGLTSVPEPLALDGETETLRFIPGDSGGDGWRHQHDERGLRSAARLLRELHDASVGWVPPDGAVFVPPADDERDPDPSYGDEVVFCQGDPGPWNFVWHDREAVALLDWDFLHPGRRVDDVAYALIWFAPLRDDDDCLVWHHFPELPDRRARVEAFLDAYGWAGDLDVAEAAIQRRWRTVATLRALAEAGVEPQRTWVEEGSIGDELAEIRWIEDNRRLLD